MQFLQATLPIRVSARQDEADMTATRPSQSVLVADIVLSVLWQFPFFSR